MAVFQKPFAAGRPLDDYMVIGHILDLAIVESGLGEKFYAQADENIMPVGTYVRKEEVRPVTLLPSWIQCMILQELNGGVGV